jgi:hypothetical protein
MIQPRVCPSKVPIHYINAITEYIISLHKGKRKKNRVEKEGRGVGPGIQYVYLALLTFSLNDSEFVRIIIDFILTTFCSKSSMAKSDRRLVWSTKLIQGKSRYKRETDGCDFER